MAFVWQSGAKLARNDNSDTEKLLLPWSFAILSLSFVGNLSFNEEEGGGGKRLLPIRILLQYGSSSDAF